MAWLQGPAKDWNAQIRDTWSRATNSVQRLAEQAELQQFGDIVLASAQTLAEQGEAALRASKESVVDGVVALGFLSEKDIKDDSSDGQSLRAFKSDVRVLSSTTSGPPADDEIVGILSGWVELLYAEGAVKPASRVAFLQSRAPQAALVALACTPNGRGVIRGAATSRKRSDAPSADANATELLHKVLACTSAAPPDLLGQLLGFLAGTAEAVLSGETRKGAKSSKGNATTPVGVLLGSRDFRWVVALITAALVDVNESPLFEITQRRELVERTLAAQTTAATSLGTQLDLDATLAPAPRVGDRVWAEWPGDGRWYHGQVHSGGDGQLEVAWARLPADVECGKDAEYLPAPARDRKERTWLAQAAVVPSYTDRPVPTLLTGEQNWMKQVEAAETFAVSFLKLRELCEEFTRSPPAVAEGASAAAEDALKGIAGSLRDLRTKRARDGEPAQQGFVPQPGTSMDSKSELVALQQEEQRLRERALQLTQERTELQARLKALDDDLATVTSAATKVAQRMRDLLEGRAQGGSELPPQQSAGQDACRHTPERQRFLAEAGAVSRSVEDLLATRAQEASGASTAVAALAGRQQAVASACLDSEQRRRRQLENLLIGMHAAIWGPEADQFVQDPARLSCVRKLLAHAMGLTEQAWRQMVQLAAESLSADSHALGAASEDMSRSAERYKEMRQELQGNLDRLAKLEAAMPQRSFGPPARAPPQPAHGIPAAAAPVAAAPAGNPQAAASPPVTNLMD